MLRAISEMAVAISVRSVAEKPARAAISRRLLPGDDDVGVARHRHPLSVALVRAPAGGRAERELDVRAEVARQEVAGDVELALPAAVGGRQGEQGRAGSGRSVARCRAGRAGTRPGAGPGCGSAGRRWHPAWTRGRRRATAVSFPSTSWARRISRSACDSRARATLTSAASSRRTASSSGRGSASSGSTSRCALRRARCSRWTRTRSGCARWRRRTGRACRARPVTGPPSPGPASPARCRRSGPGCGCARHHPADHRDEVRDRLVAVRRRDLHVAHATLSPVASPLQDAEW